MKTIFQAVVAGLFALSASISFATTNLTDAQIAGIVVAANTVDINAGKLAESKATNKNVKAFGKQMVTDHTAVNDQAKALVKKLHVTPEESDTSKKLKEDGAKTLAHLKSLHGKEFDKAYIDNEVTYHQTVIDALDNTLIPNAQNSELKGMLVKVRPAFVGHLEHAKQIQSTLK
jgi:putative membrane protein